MAKGREPVKFEGFESESSEEEDEDEGSEEDASSDSDSGPDQNQIAKEPSPLPPTAIGKPQPQAASKIQDEQMKEELESETETETDSGSGSESDSEEPDPNVSGPVDGPKISNGGAGKLTPKARVSDPVTLVRASGAKRPAEENDIEAKDVKKSKTKQPEHELETSVKRSDDDSKKQLFQRLWSEDDEIAILEGMIDYAERKKSDPVADLHAFHNFIRDNLHVDVTKSQLQDKIRRLKKKYENNKGKEKEGKERIFSKPHERKAYELSKQIWGCENGKERSPKVNGSAIRRNQRINVIENGEFEDAKNMAVANGGLDRLWSSMAMKSNEVSMDERVHRIGSELFGRNDGVEGSREWRMLMVQDIENHLKMLELKRAQAKLVLDVLKSLDE